MIQSFRFRMSTSSIPTSGLPWVRRQSMKNASRSCVLSLLLLISWSTPRKTPSCCTVCRLTVAKRSPTKFWTALRASCSTRPRTGSISRRRSWLFSSASNSTESHSMNKGRGYPRPLFILCDSVELLAEEKSQDRLLDMEPVLGLVEHDALRAVQNFVGDLFATVSRQTVQHDGVFLGVLHEISSKRERTHDLHAFLMLCFLTHGSPDVGIDDVDILDRNDGIVGHENRTIALLGDLSCGPDDVFLGLEPLG